MFFDVSYRFFSLNSNFQAECQLGKFEHFCIFNVKGQFQGLTNEARNKCRPIIPHFYVILTGQSISEIILIIQGHLQGQLVNFKVK